MEYPAWYYRNGKATAGPISWRHLVAWWRAGKISQQTPVPSEGTDDWTYFLDSLERRRATESYPASHSPEEQDFITDAKGWSTGPVAPWRRYGARRLDTTIHAFLSVMVPAFAFVSFAPISAERFFQFLHTPAGMLVSFVIAPVLAGIVGGFVVGSTGTSIGKAIFGVRVVNANCQAIGIIDGLRREFWVWVVGLGLGIPIVSIFTMLRAKKQLRNDGTTVWDAGRNLVFYRPDGRFQYIMNALGILLILIAVIIEVRILRRL
jgi:uncharacterized RDD family membrane protein YckC